MKSASFNRSILAAFGAMLVAATIAIGPLTPTVTADDDQPAAAEAPEYLPNLPLVDQAGHPFNPASLKGKPVLVGFIHTDCQGPCELMTAKMKAIADDLQPSFKSKVTMLAVTTDPKEDGPPQLAAYAKAQGAEGPGWVFLTGKPADVAQVLKTYEVPQDDPGDEMTHVLDLYLIGPHGREIHHYHGLEIKTAAVAADIRAARAGQ